MKKMNLKIEEISVVNSKIVTDMKLSVIPNLLSYGYKDGSIVKKVIDYVYDKKPGYILVPSEVNSFNRLGAGDLQILRENLLYLAEVAPVIMASDRNNLELFENMKARILSVNDSSFNNNSMCISSDDRSIENVDYDKFNINLLCSRTLSDDYLKHFNSDLVISSTTKVDSDSIENKIYIKNNIVNGYTCSSDSNSIGVATIKLSHK